MGKLLYASNGGGEACGPGNQKHSYWEWLKRIFLFSLLLMAFVCRQNDEPCEKQKNNLLHRCNGPLLRNRPLFICINITCHVFTIVVTHDSCKHNSQYEFHITRLKTHHRTALITNSLRQFNHVEHMSYIRVRRG